ncbi:STAS domain-containing protein [Camelliibacillus cellulosilyticus]|uniref:STAS domain-containing protein n=1 Tax=Camelliibacillus cellulosilyticus TaxID=2174486 RepID=A0ABV9GL38_9BACL
MDTTVIRIIQNRKTEITRLWKERMNDIDHGKDNEFVNDRAVMVTNENFAELIYDYLAENQNEGKLNDLIGRMNAFGWPLSYLSQGMQIFRRVVTSLIIEEGENKDTLLSLFKEIDDLLDPIFRQIIEDATSSWENTVTIQKRALMELSAPLIPIMERIAVMPLIGTIDTERAKLIMENLLEGVISHRAEVVLIDITGVPVVDTMVAHHIIQASEAVRLVGSECILVGIRPEIAQTIVNLGIALGDFPTRSTLQKGVETALEITNRKIITTDKGASL